MHDFSHCPRCRAATIPSTTYVGATSEFWVECTNCNTYINTYIPQDHQMAVHKDPHTYIGNFGAYGTGKTLTSREELYKHMFITNNANILVGANVSAQYEQTIKRDLELDLPKAFISNYSAQKTYYDIINGARIMFRSFDDPDKLRSLNLTMFVIVEASEVDGDAFVQLKTRLRNLKATTPLRNSDGVVQYRDLPNGQKVPIIDADWRRGIIESNPDSGWIRSMVLLNSDTIDTYGTVADNHTVHPDARDPAIASHVASTDVNGYLPPTFIAELVKNKPAWWVSRYIHSSFTYAEGLVYPSYPNTLCAPFDIPIRWKRIVAADYGLADPFRYVFGAIDEKDGILYIYKVVSTNDKNIEELSKLYFAETKDIPVGGLLTPPIMDPKSGAKRDYNKKTLYDHFLEEGIAFKPGHVSIDARILRLNTYMLSGKLKIFDTCTILINELREYKFPAKVLGGKSRSDPNKPIDKNNHAINPLEWITMELPSNPKNILYGIYDRDGLDVTQISPRSRILPHALSDDNDYDSNSMYEMEEFPWR